MTYHLMIQKSNDLSMKQLMYCTVQTDIVLVDDNLGHRTHG